jgi:hypothetical protein
LHWVLLLQTTYYPNLRYPNGQEVPVRPYKNIQSYSGQSNYYAGNNEYYTGNYFTGNYQPSYYYGYGNNYDYYYYPEDIESYENRIKSAIDIGLLISVSIKRFRNKTKKSNATITKEFPPLNGSEFITNSLKGHFNIIGLASKLLKL